MATTGLSFCFSWYVALSTTIIALPCMLGNTVFSRSEAAATNFFSSNIWEATIQGWRLNEGSVYFWKSRRELVFLITAPLVACTPCVKLTVGLMDLEEFTVYSVVRGHHVYEEIWTLTISEELPVEDKGEKNEHDCFAIAVQKGSITVEHVPRDLSRTFCFFLRRCGSSITCTINGHGMFGMGLEVPCFYTLTGKPRYIKRLVKHLCNTKSKEEKE